MTSDGEMNEKGINTKESLVEQIKYLNNQLLTLITDIINTSTVQPIIILVGDHGIKKEQAVALDNYFAVYATDTVMKELYGTMTPVNIFRIILRNQFGEDLPIIEDRGYVFQKYGYPGVSEVRNTCN